VISKVYGNGGNKTASCQHSFIELTNTGSRALNLGGLALYYKTAAAGEYTSFALPSVSLGVGKSFLIRCAAASNYDTTAEVIRLTDYDATWNITISNKEIRLVLSASGKSLSKTVQPAELSEKISYFVATDSYYFDTGYVDNYSKNKVAVRTAMKQDSGYYLQNLTKTTTDKLSQIVPSTMSGKKAQIIGSKLNEVLFSSPAGFYTSTVNLTLTAPAGYNTVYYTLDGSDPTKSSSRKVYSSPIGLADTSSIAFGKTYNTGLGYVGNIRAGVSRMLGARVVKAAAYNGKEYTGVYTNTYIISSKMKDYGVTVMSVSMDINEIFGDPGFYHNFNASSNDPNTRGKGFMEVFDENGVRRGYSYVELAVSGHGSSGVGNRSFKVFYKGSQNTEDGTESKLNYDLFDGYAVNSKGQNITEFSRLLLRNSGNDVHSSLIRDAYMQRVSKNLNVDTMAYAPVLLFINGDFWGVYNARERYSGDYVESHYGIDKDNVALIESDYSQVHTNQNAPFIVSSGLDGDADDFNTLVNYIKSNNMSNSSSYNYVASKLDIDSFIDMYVSRLYFSARDWPENNIKVWRNRATNDPSGFDNKWHFTLLDMDMGISFFTDANNTTENSNFFGWIDATGCVVGNIMHGLIKNSTFKKKFLARFYEVLNEIYIPSEMEAELDKIVAERAPIFDLQLQRWPGITSGSYSTSVSNMRKFIYNRYKYAISYLCSYMGITESYLQNLSGNYVTVSFSSTRLSVTIDGVSVSDSYTKKFDKTVTLNVVARPKTGFEVLAVIFTDTSGNVTRYNGGTASITTSKGGEITFETKKTATDVSLSVHPGIVAGGEQMYYLTEDGKLYAWGYNPNNVLGAGAGKDVISKPVMVRENVAQIEVCHSNDVENSNHGISAAILTLDGDIYIIGSGSVAPLGSSSTWKLVEFDGYPVSISVGFDHMLILDKDGNVWGIGNNSYGQLGTPDVGGTVNTFRKIASNAVMISAGRRNSAYVDRNGDCYVLGDARWNKFNGSTDNITSPYKLLSGVSYISSGEHEMILVTEDGKLYYAGWRSIQGFGQGTGTAGAAKLNITGVEKAAIHFGNMVILTESGAMYVYGLNTGNALGSAVTGGTPSKAIGSGIRDVAAGYDFIAYMLTDGTVKVTGSNAYGQAGNGTTSEYVSGATVQFR
jgi:alpha-tubulin suppressor-like RCC1 family protein